MKTHDYAPWISPVTGKATQEVLPDLPLDDIWVGSPEGIPGDPSTFQFRPLPSPLLQDIRLDLLDLERDVAPIRSLSDGFMWMGNEDGLPEETKLSYAVLPTPGSVLEIIPVPNPMFGGSITDPVMSNPVYPQVFTAQYTGTKNVLDPRYMIEVLKDSNWKTGVSNSFALAQFRIEQALARTRIGKMIMQTRSMNYNWPNRVGMNAIPDAIKSLYGLGETFSFDGAQALDELAGLPGLSKIRTDGSFALAVPREDYVDPLQLDEAVAELLETLETEIAALQAEIATLEGLIDVLGLATLLSGGLSLAALLSALLNRQDQTEQTIQNIFNDFDQTIQNAVFSSSQFEQNVLSVFENAFNTWAGDQVQNIVQNAFESWTVQPGQLELYEDHIFLGDHTGKASPVPLSDLGFATLDNLTSVTGDVTFSGTASGLQSRIRNDPVFYGKTITLPSGTTSERPSQPFAGMLRLNTTLQ